MITPRKRVRPSIGFIFRKPVGRLLAPEIGASSPHPPPTPHDISSELRAEQMRWMSEMDTRHRALLEQQMQTTDRLFHQIEVMRQEIQATRAEVDETRREVKTLRKEKKGVLTRLWHWIWGT